MKYNIRMSCGHEDTINLIGKSEIRERKIKHFEEYGLCKKCYAEEQNKNNSNGCNEVQMPYSEYKQNYSEYKTKIGSYCDKDKTVVVYVPTNEVKTGKIYHD